MQALKLEVVCFQMTVCSILKYVLLKTAYSKLNTTGLF